MELSSESAPAQQETPAPAEEPQTSTSQPIEEHAAEDNNDVVGYLPRYAMPNISSMLPAYTNAEGEFIFRTFNTGNYDMLKHLPDDIKYQQVVAARTTRMEMSRQFLMPKLGGPLLKSGATNQQDLFSVFEYIPSKFSIQDEIAAAERVESEAKRFAIGGKEWTPTGALAMGKAESLVPGQQFPYLGGPYESTDDQRLTEKKAREIAQVSVHQAAPFTAPGADKVGEKPTRAVALEMMNNVRKWILQDWEGADVAIFENHQDCWVIRVGAESVDSVDGLAAYMNVFVRCNELVCGYKLNKVVEFWHTQPDDGGVYYVLRPPWVRASAVHAFYTLHPEERHWSTSHAVQEVARTRRVAADGDPEEGEEGGPGGNKSALSYASRLEWGVNFLTNTPAPKVLSKVVS